MVSRQDSRRVPDGDAPRRSGDIDVVVANGVVGDDAQPGPAASRNSSSTRSVRSVRTPSQPATRRSSSSRGGGVVLPDIGLAGRADRSEPLVGQDPRDEDPRAEPSAMTQPVDERPDPVQRFEEVRLRVRVADPDVLVTEDAEGRPGKTQTPASSSSLSKRSWPESPSRRSTGTRRTRRAAAGTRCPGSLQAVDDEVARAWNSATIASTSSCGPVSAATAPTWANVGAPLTVLMMSWP